MPRVPRLDFPDALHHVMNRGARHAPILGEDEARALFMEVLAGLPERFGVELHGYALMPNHYHLLIGTPRGNLSRAMRHLGAVFTQRLNAAHGWDGPVFRGRFRNRLVGDKRYWMHLLAYVHLNPVPYLVDHPEDWPWSSHRAYLGLDAVPKWLTIDNQMRAYGSPAAVAEYINEHRIGTGTIPEGWDVEDLWTPEPTAVIRPPGAATDTQLATVQLAIEEVCTATTLPESELLPSLRGRRDNRARWLMAWWLTRRAGLTYRQVGHHMACKAPNVANMMFRLRQIEEDKEVEGWKERLEGFRRERDILSRMT